VDYNKYVNMRFIESLCPPALLYLIFLVIQLGLDLSLGMWVTFGIKLILGLAVVKVLDTFCGIGLTPVSWVIIATPFIITALATAISMGSRFDEVILLQFQEGDMKEKFTDGTRTGIRQPNPPEAGGPPEPGITPVTQSWTEGAAGNKWGTNYDPKWSRDASDSNGEVLLTQMGRKGLQINFLNTL
jgi:hypothetical protein